MQSTAIWTPFEKGLAQRPMPPTGGLPPEPPTQPPATPTGQAMALSAPFSEEEVRGGRQLLHNVRSAGSSGLPAELLRYALGLAPSPDTPPPNGIVPASPRCSFAGCRLKLCHLPPTSA